MVRNNGSSTGLTMVLRWPPSRASRARMPPEEEGRGAEGGGPGRTGVAPEGVGRLSGVAASAVGTTSSGKDTPRGTVPSPRTTGKG
ncbi:hypothetical protein GCM10010193_46420 [Kitasatospora atroaurantiaca]